MKHSSIIVLTRGHGDDLEVFWSRRQFDMAFLGGFWAFAGGSVEDDDGEVPLNQPPPRGFPSREHYGCAARELFEELGLLVGDNGLRHVSEDSRLKDLRSGVRRGADFARLLRERGEVVDADRFWPIGRWITPEWFDLRYDSEFFAVSLTAAENERFGAALADHLLEAEIVEGEWVSPRDALKRWRSAARFVTPPIRYLLEAFQNAQVARDVNVDSADIGFGYDAWLTTDGVYLVPLRSPTIPPATHTNCFIVGDERFVIVDPGSPYASEQDLLARLVDEMIDDGHELVAAVLTHHHPDHVGGVDALVQRYGCEVWAHENTARQSDFEVGRLLHDEDRIELDDDTLVCLFTPGHASGHLCFLHERTGGIFAGDLIASHGTILVNPPDGHMGDYLASLRRLRELEPTALYPAHGWIVTTPLERLDYYVEHRLQREEKVYRALEKFGEPATAADIVPEAYDDAPRAVWPIAARSAQAHLIHLAELGRVRTRDDDRWSIA